MSRGRIRGTTFHIEGDNTEETLRPEEFAGMKGLK